MPRSMFILRTAPATLALLLLLPVAAAAQALPFRIAEVAPAPTAGDQILELVNTSAAGANAGGWFLCHQFQYFALPSTFVPAGGRLRVHVAASGSDTATDIFSGPALPPLGTASEGVSLYRPGPGGVFFFNDPANLIDFVQYGAGNQPRASEAVSAGVWPAVGSFAPAPGSGQSLAWDGAGETPGDWFRDASPTLGTPNLSPTAAISPLGPGCSLPAANAGLDVLSAPALGNLDFGLRLDSDEPGRLCALWFNLGSGNLPLFGGLCTLYVSTVPPQLELFFVTDGAGDLTLPAPIPDDPVLLGVGIGFQFLVDNAGAFPEFDLSEGVLVTF